MSMTPSTDPQAGRSLKVVEAPLDPAQQLLADALRTSFRILKLAMIVLVVLFVASGTFVVEQSEQAVVLRLGRRVGAPRDAGLSWALPYPIDEVLKMPVKQSNSLAIDSHWFFVREEERGRPLSEIGRGRSGLNPTRDGALLTGDKGLVHIKWRLTYRIDDMVKYVSTVADAQTEKVERLITKLLEHAAIDVAGGYTTEEATRKRLSDLRTAVRAQVNAELERLDTGIVIESVEIPESTPPLQTRLAFDNVVRQENLKQSTIRQAQQQAADKLNKTAGAAHATLTTLLDDLDRVQAQGAAGEVERLNNRINEVLERETAGDVASQIRKARSYYTSAVEEIRGDVEQYDALLAEYRDRPQLLLSRLWEETMRRILSNPDITKVYRPAGEFRLHIGPDPRQRERREQEKYRREQGVLEKGRPQIVYPEGIPQ